MTRAELRALLRLTLADAGVWPDGSLDAWVAAGIGFYAAHFGDCPAPVLDTDVIAVPAMHLEAITAYVEFAALKALQVAESIDTDGSSLALGQLSDQARRAWLRYKDVIDQLVAITTAPAAGVG
jgi:hypothetical protein